MCGAFSSSAHSSCSDEFPGASPELQPGLRSPEGCPEPHCAFPACDLAAVSSVVDALVWPGLPDTPAALGMLKPSTECAAAFSFLHGHQAANPVAVLHPASPSTQLLLVFAVEFQNTA